MPENALHGHRPRQRQQGRPQGALRSAESQVAHPHGMLAVELLRHAGGPSSGGPSPSPSCWRLEPQSLQSKLSEDDVAERDCNITGPLAKAVGDFAIPSNTTAKTPSKCTLLTMLCDALALSEFAHNVFSDSRSPNVVAHVCSQIFHFKCGRPLCIFREVRQRVAAYPGCTNPGCLSHGHESTRKIKHQ